MGQWVSTQFLHGLYKRHFSTFNALYIIITYTETFSVIEGFIKSDSITEQHWPSVALAELRYYPVMTVLNFNGNSVLIARAHMSACFLPRDTMSMRGLRCRPMSLSVCPSVRLSHWWIVSTRLKISSNFFLGPPQPHHSSFLTPGAGIQFQGEPVQQGRKVHGVRKFCDFPLESPFISETVRDRLMVAMEC